MLDDAFKPLFAGRKRTTALSNVDVELTLELTVLDALPDAIILEVDVSCAEPSIFSETVAKAVILEADVSCAEPSILSKSVAETVKALLVVKRD